MQTKEAKTKAKTKTEPTAKQNWYNGSLPARRLEIVLKRVLQENRINNWRQERNCCKTKTYQQQVPAVRDTTRNHLREGYNQKRRQKQAYRSRDLKSDTGRFSHLMWVTIFCRVNDDSNSIPILYLPNSIESAAAGLPNAIVEE